MLVFQAPRRTASPARAVGLPALFCALAIAATSAHAAGKAHAHGDARLDVAIEPQRLSLQFSSPLDNLVGFERAPRNDKERQQVDAAVARLNAADTMFRIDAAAQCKLAKVELASAALKLGPVDPAQAKSDHADIDASYEFSCTDATKARHIDIGLFEFKRLHRLDVQVAASTGQFKRALKPSATRLSLAR
ncbi:DUF2796 domain-containing protein [Piscinibacter sp. HJYY11]|uniref:DUF2796 domain-containing protein n=1 Tax=Piscinibacter sp. HJYY11 TaxID=2801333 RepID=UPI00191E69C7|nr:DUF2796 domain-containing protein [Piscinibacter sp. HJYY11]MBL0726439.1 DUF2796 domain-containing protein [Piscinibacter sp. HJYY11]